MPAMLVATYNYQGGGRLTSKAGFDMRALQHEFAGVDQPPALVLLCEAKNYRDNGNEGLHHAAEALADELSVPYVGVLGTSDRGPMPPAIFYNPDVLTLRSWCNPDDPGVFDDKRNIARFAVNASGPVRETRTEFLAFVRHFNARSGVIRRQQAGLLDRYGRASIPVIGGGDLNSTASGPHFPQRDWTTADYQSRSHKGVIGNDGTWQPDTAAVDHLIGRWDDTTKRRIDGCGFSAIAELEWQKNNTPILPTVNPNVDAGGGLHIDYLLVNDAMKPHVVPGSFRVHTLDGPLYPSDHRLVTAVINL